MGCDIHFKLEQLSSVSGECKPVINWTHCACTLQRDYVIFDIMGGINLEKGISRLYHRGFPKDANLMTKSAYGYEIDDDFTDYNDDGMKVVSSERAKEWLDNKWSEKLEDPVFDFVSDPDTHDANWIFVEEYEHIFEVIGDLIKQHKIKDYEIDDCYYALLEFMKVYRHAGITLRMVYWFDN